MRRRSWKDPIDGMAYDFFDGIRKGLGSGPVLNEKDSSRRYPETRTRRYTRKPSTLWLRKKGQFNKRVKRLD